MKKILLLVCVTFILGAATQISCAQKEALEVGAKAPDFTLQDIAGQEVSLKDVLASNKSTLLVFWATWCPSCRREIPELIRLNNEYKSKGLKILTVNLGESPGKVKSFAEQQGIEYAVLLDKDNKVGSQYGVMYIPTNILLDKNGMVKYKGTSPPTEDLLPQK
ncbi:MAG: TlpA family protein disulfide reductase [Candidatus Omnitrophica bacterium]|nr:TlpA family protein disulfide reductase [Candidatus Omnitrophota bacterium]